MTSWQMWHIITSTSQLAQSALQTIFPKQHFLSSFPLQCHSIHNIPDNCPIPNRLFQCLQAFSAHHKEWEKAQYPRMPAFSVHVWVISHHKVSSFRASKWLQNEFQWASTLTLSQFKLVALPLMITSAAGKYNLNWGGGVGWRGIKAKYSWFLVKSPQSVVI